MKFAIIISTYKRDDGNTPFLLKRCLNSISNQLHDDYKIFLIGDRYENNEEFIEICNTFENKDKIYFENLNIASERDVFNNKLNIWKFGGVNAVNHAIDISKNEGFNYIVRIDHDDFWENNHLKSINDCIELTNSAFVCTKSKYYGEVLPSPPSHEKYIEFKPSPGNLVHSSICFDLNQLPLKYRTLGDIKCGVYAADGCLYLEIAELVEKNNLKSILINEITCNVESDSFFIRNGRN